jgi:hypothetical protein
MDLFPVTADIVDRRLETCQSLSIRRMDSFAYQGRPGTGSFGSLVMLLPNSLIP